jgi:hypothetical protein
MATILDDKQISGRANYWNTTNLSGDALKKAVALCTLQEKRILELMEQDAPMTPLKVWSLYELAHGFILATSVRRSMTGLSNEGKDGRRPALLRKLPDKVKERYGRPNHLWEKI